MINMNGRQNEYLSASPLRPKSGVLTFYPTVRFSYLGLLRMRASILHLFSHAEQQYLMYLHYCEGRFRVGVGVDVNKTQFNR